MTTARRTAGPEVREVGPDDWQVWRVLRLAALAEAPRAFGSRLADWVAAPEERWRERLSLPGTHLVARLDGVDAAMVSGVEVDDHAEVLSLWVAPTARGHGLGGLLLEEVAQWATSRRLRAVVLDVAATNAPATALYRRAGFVDAGPSPEDGCERRMRRDLRSGRVTP